MHQTLLCFYLHLIKSLQTLKNIVSVDDGYTSQDNLDSAISLGINTVSFSGSKGKKITEDDWDKDINKYARNKRSAVESFMFTGKFNHEFGQLARRGIEAVGTENLEKVIAYNFMHILRKKNDVKHYKSTE